MSAPVDPARRRHLAAGLLALHSGLASAQGGEWSDRKLRLTVAYPPGGVSDETARELARRLTPRLGQRVIIDYRPGAGGAIAMFALAQARAEEDELCFSAITPLLRVAQPGLRGLDLARDIAPVAAIMRTPVLVVATPAFGGSSLADAIQAAGRRPGALRWASSGHGTTGALVHERICAATGVDIVHVPYAGGGQQINDALAGHFELLSTNVAARQLAHLRDGRLRALALGAPRRLSMLPDVPTLAELGFVGANLSSLFGVFASGKASTERLDRWHAEFDAVRAQADFQQWLLASANLPVDGSRQDFVRRIAAETQAMR